MPSTAEAREPSELPVRPQEELLVQAVTAYASRSPDRILCTSQGVAQLAVAAAQQFPAAAVVCHWLDLYRADAVRSGIGGKPANLSLACSADFPDGPFDIVALPTSAQGEAELTRELLQQAHERLAVGGTLFVSTDNPCDRWLGSGMQTLFRSVSRNEHATGVVYAARKTSRPARRRDFSCEFAFRDRGRLFQVRTRPGVFSHRRVDPGARRLMEAMEIEPGDRVLDIGCGGGVLALAAAARAEGVSVLAVDSHARAVECTAWGADRNGLANLTVEQSATGPSASAGPFDVVLANPPYYAGLRIARFFLETAQKHLRPAGRIYIVSKHPAWYREQMPQHFSDVVVEPSNDYWIARGVK